VSACRLAHSLDALINERGVVVPAVPRIKPGDNVVLVETAASRFDGKAEARTAELLNRARHT
jgi:hypothetical protein